MDDDFERRRELRRQKREEMRLEAERVAYQRNDEDEEEAARERRRRARQERMKSREGEEPSGQTDTLAITNSHSVTESSGGGGEGGGDDEEQALMERMAKREERRQRRLKEAQERQQGTDARDNDRDHGDAAANSAEEERPLGRRGRYHDNEEEEEQGRKTTVARGREEEEEKEEEEEAAPEEEEEKEEVEEDKPSRSYMREQESCEEKTNLSHMQNEVSQRGGAREQGEWQRKQNGGLHEETPPMQNRKPERTLSRGSMRAPEPGVGEDPDDAARQEAERKLEELKRRRDDAEVEEFERMRQKQQEAEQELEELKKKREERRKVLEEEDRQKKQEEEERKAREEEEKRRMKEEIERRRAEAAEKRQKVEDTMEGGEAKPFKCVSPRGSSLKIGERAEFLNKSAQKSSLKLAHSPVVSKIGNRLEQYTSAAQRENKDSRSPRSGAVDLPMVTDGIRNIKSMWEKGNVFTSPGGAGGTFKEAAGMKIGVAGRINDWLNKTPESKTPGGRPADLKPGDVTNKRSLWENKGASPTKVTGRGEAKSVTNGMGH
ncbi:caldesmon 1a isoform X1 [Osmerus mordax]|uniref:caldesmon 1a isoform X1 n=1 Tax=Osmerus mordax TaxID=8014 RepID=UPI00350EC64D